MKYLNNEITNIESKFTAYLISDCEKNNDFTGALIKSLIDTERNFILNRGQTTVDLEKDRLDQKQIKEMVSIINSIAKKFSGMN